MFNTKFSTIFRLKGFERTSIKANHLSTKAELVTAESRLICVNNLRSCNVLRQRNLVTYEMRVIMTMSRSCTGA